MTTRENDLLLQFMEMVFPKDLLRYFELTGFREEAVSEKDRFGVESGELIVSLEERDCFRNPIEGHTYRPNGFYEASKVRDFPLRDKKMTLLIKRRRWIDETTGKSVGNNYELAAEGGVPCSTSNCFVLKTDIVEPCTFDMELNYIADFPLPLCGAVKIVSDNLCLDKYEHSIRHSEDETWDEVRAILKEFE